MNNSSEQQLSRINDALHVIHRDISAELVASELAKVAAYSEHHFHRVFKRIVGESVNVYIRRTRLEHAANQLMFDQQTRVIDIAQKCGFGSLSSFTHAFKDVFKTTPAKWRTVNRALSSPPYLADKEIAAGHRRVANTALKEPKLIMLNEIPVAYVRHKGYGRSIGQAWQTLRFWAQAHKRDFGNIASDDINSAGQQIGLHHSNPEWVALEDCRYVACVTIGRPITRRGIVNSLSIPGGLHAAFDLQGRYGELLPLIGKALTTWLPDSGYTLQTTPVVIHFRKNHLLEASEEFDARVHLPISII